MSTAHLQVHVEGRGTFSESETYLQAALSGTLSSNPSWQDHPGWECPDSTPGVLHTEIVSLFRNADAPGLRRLRALYLPISKDLDGFGWMIRIVFQGPEPPHLYANHNEAVFYAASLTISATYPKKCPSVKFDQIIYHPNIEQRTLTLHDAFYAKLDWNPISSTLSQLIQAIIDLVDSPIPPKGPSDHDVKHMWHHDSPEKLELSPEAQRIEIEQFKHDWFATNYLPVAQELAQYQHERLCNMINYAKKYPRIFDATKPLEPDWFHPDLWAALEAKTPTALRSVLTEISPGVYTLPFFSKAFCDVFLEEIIAFERSGLPWRRPNSMNKYGVVVDDIGMESIMQRMMSDVISPFASLLYGRDGGGSLDHHHAFVVQYQQGQDMKLEMHTDDSEVTLNICLGLEGFKGSGLTFCGQYPLDLKKISLIDVPKGRLFPAVATFPLHKFA